MRETASPPDTDLPPPAPANWTAVRRADGVLSLTFALRKWPLGLGLGGGLVLLFGWGVWGFLKNWFVDRAEILPGGVVLCLVFLAGTWSGLYVLDRLIFASTTYDLEAERLVVLEKTLFRRKLQVIRKDAIRKILINYVPPGPESSTSNPGTYATLIVHNIPDTGGKTTNFAMEGWTERESNWLAPLLAIWAEVKYRRIENGED
jgi:hypothetical protein